MLQRSMTKYFSRADGWEIFHTRGKWGKYLREDSELILGQVLLNYHLEAGGRALTVI